MSPFEPRARRAVVSISILFAALVCACAPEESSTDVGDGIRAPSDTGVTSDVLDSGTDADAADAEGSSDTTDAEGSGGFPAELASDLALLVGSAPRDVGAPGVTVQVSSPGLGSWSGAAGLASTEDATPIQPDDRLRIGSITKTFNAAVILLLIQDGTVGLHDPVDDWVDGFDFGPDITIETLLNHTSGIYNFTDDANFVAMGAEPAEPEEIVAFAEEHDRTNEPGANWNYSNTGYLLLGLVIEAATDGTFGEAIHSLLLEPFGLDDTFVQPEDADAEFVRGHTLGNEATDLVHPSWAGAAGGMISTGGDLCTWMTGLYTGAVLTTPSTDAMLEQTRLPDDSHVPYGYGVQHYVRGGVDVVGHTGSTMGFRGEAFFDLESGTCVAILSNDFFAEPADFADDVWTLVLAAL